MKKLNEMNQTAPLLEFISVSKNYGPKIALKDVSFRLESGRITCLLGPNGSGKTTLLKLINGLLQPAAGQVRIHGLPPGIESKARVSYLPERTYLNDWMRVRELLEFFRDFYRDFNVETARRMLGNLNINERDKLKTMSKGTKEKVQLILVMSREADLYLLDEPIAGVDPAARDYILNTIVANYRPEASVLISTHLIQDVEQICDEVIFLNQGNIVLNDTVDNIRDTHGKSIDQLFREVFRC